MGLKRSPRARYQLERVQALVADGQLAVSYLAEELRHADFDVLVLTGDLLQRNDASVAPELILRLTLPRVIVVFIVGHQIRGGLSKVIQSQAKQLIVELDKRLLFLHDDFLLRVQAGHPKQDLAAGAIPQLVCHSYSMSAHEHKYFPEVHVARFGRLLLDRDYIRFQKNRIPALIDVHRL